MLGLLMVMQDHLVFEGFLAVKAEGFEAGHVSLFSAHAYSYKLLLKRMGRKYHGLSGVGRFEDGDDFD